MRFCIWLVSLAMIACEARPAAREPERGDFEKTSVAPDSLDDTSRGAEEVVRAYYAAINDRDYQRAYDAWGSDGPPGRPTVRAFGSGFAATDSVYVAIGQPGRIEGAAGSRYVSIPVRVRAFEHGIGLREYVGSYVVRRSVVSGSDAANRAWHLYSAKLH